MSMKAVLSFTLSGMFCLMQCKISEVLNYQEHCCKDPNSCTWLPFHTYWTFVMYTVRSELLTVVLLAVQFLGLVTLCHWVCGSWHFEEARHLYLQESSNPKRQNGDPEDEGTTFIQDMAKNLLSDILSHPRRPETSRWMLLQTVISQD